MTRIMNSRPSKNGKKYYPHGRRGSSALSSSDGIQKSRKASSLDQWRDSSQQRRSPLSADTPPRLYEQENAQNLIPRHSRLDPSSMGVTSTERRLEDSLDNESLSSGSSRESSEYTSRRGDVHRVSPKDTPDSPDRITRTKRIRSPTSNSQHCSTDRSSLLEKRTRFKSDTEPFPEAETVISQEINAVLSVKQTEALKKAEKDTSSRRNVYEEGAFHNNFNTHERDISSDQTEYESQHPDDTIDNGNQLSGETYHTIFKMSPSTVTPEAHSTVICDESCSEDSNEDPSCSSSDSVFTDIPS